jgi:hypothetical protein
MKQVISVLIIAAFFRPLGAVTVNSPQAARIALERVERDGHGNTHSIAGMTELFSPALELPVAFVFELHPTGFVVTAADTDLPPVVCYSYENGCSDDERGRNPLKELVVRDMETRLACIDQTPGGIIGLNNTMWEGYTSGSFSVLSPALFEQWPPEGSTPTGGWLMENWHQSAPYNQYCPMDIAAGVRSVAGCPAVAMAAIVNFRENTNGTRFDDTDDYYHNYHEYYWIDDDFEAHDFPSWPVLNGYMETIDNLYSTQQPLTQQDKAALVYASGAACRQVYTASVSGTFGVDQAYDAYIRFGFEECELLDGSSDSLYERLSQNMIDSLPAHLAIVDSGPTYGHNVVVDGYNTDDFYHINFGWNGPYNGWYQFPLTGMPYGMNIIEGIIIDIGADPLCTEEGTCPDNIGVVTLSSCANPAASPVFIDLTANHESTVTINAYSVTGRLLGTIANGGFSAGTHRLSWNTEGVPTGMCFIVASGPWGTESIRVTVLR